ncbi:MAG: hypothetical protein K9L85_00595 [Candidatus Peribacteraceae bacterium]|nr:hypothetical protein [Candidatus Peribacteraceae bacterium]
MPPKTKIKIRRSRPAVRFTVRRIANKNPRNARSFRQFRQKLSRLTAGLLAFGLLVSGMFLGGGDSVRSELAAVNETDVYTCTAGALTEDFEDLTTRLANLSRQFPELIDNLDFCGEGGCAAEDQIYDDENQIWQIEQDLTTLKIEIQRAQGEFTEIIGEQEDQVLFCENDSRCESAEAELREARTCEKEFSNLSALIDIREMAENEYSLINQKGESKPAANYVKKLMEDVFKNRERAAENLKFYEQCVATSDASVCQKYVAKVDEANTKVATAIAELSDTQLSINNILEKLEADIVALEIGRKDEQNLEENIGLGWCKQELKNKKSALFSKITAAISEKTAYDNALADLKAKKEALQASLQAELEAAAAQAAAEKAAAEEAVAHAAAEKAAAEKRAQAEIIFGIWSSIRNGF